MPIRDSVKGIAVDFAGVLVYDGLPPVVEEIGKLYGIPNRRLQETKDKWLAPFSLGDIDMRSFWYNTLFENGIELSDEEIIDINFRVLDSHYPYTEMMAWVKSLRPDYKTALATNSAKGWLEYWDVKFSLSQIFDVIVAPYKVGARKPHRTYFIYLANEMGLKPEEIRYIEDQRRMMEGALEAGLRAELFTCNLRTSEGVVDAK